MKYKLDVINCPNCGAEYLPAEIYYPNSLLGKPSNIHKDSLGKIDTFEGTTLNNREEFVCDFCGKPFKVFARIKFDSTIDAVNDFTESYVVPIKEKKFTLFED